MKALYKAGAHAGFELVDRPEPEAGPGDVKIRVHDHRHLRHRPAHPVLGRLGRRASSRPR